MIGRLLLLLPLMLVAVPAHAGPEEMAAVKATIGQLFDIPNGLAANSPLMPQGKRLFLLLTTILIAWTGIKVVLEQSGFNGWISQTVRVLIVVGFTAFSMQPDTQQKLAGGFTDVAGAIASASGSGSSINMDDPAAGILSIMRKGGDSILKLWGGDQLTADGKSWWQSAAQYLSLGAVAAGVVEVVSKLAISLLLLVSLGVYAAMLALSQVMLSIGLIVAPIMIPWLILEQTSFVFHGWVKFIIVAGMQKVVGAILLTMTAGLLDAVARLAIAAEASPTYDATSYLVAALLSLLMAFLMLQIPAIASSLISGLPSTSLPLKIPRPSPKPAGGTPSPKTPPVPGK